MAAHWRAQRTITAGRSRVRRQEAQGSAGVRGGGVLHVVTSTQRRGAETFAVDLSDALAVRGVPSDVVALAAARSGSTLDVPALGDAALSPATLRALRRRARGARMVVAHGSRTLPACAFALVGLPAPAVYRSIGDPTVWAGAGLRRARTRLLLGRMDAVVVLWPGAGESVRRLHGVPARKIHVIPNGRPTERCPVPDAADRAAARRDLGVPPEVPVVAIIGALSPEKRVGDAISAVAALPDVHLLVAGDGPERAALERQAEGQAAGRVHFAGVLPGPTQALAAADIVALTSRTEGIPGALIEAALSGVAAVATNVGGIGQVIKDAETGLLVPPGDIHALTAALRRALTERRRLGLAARRHCTATFDIGVIADRWAGLVASLAPANEAATTGS
jgi:glycosyltransferase involved in cell wall biosynthesis